MVVPCDEVCGTVQLVPGNEAFVCVGEAGFSAVMLGGGQGAFFEVYLTPGDIVNGETVTGVPRLQILAGTSLEFTSVNPTIWVDDALGLRIRWAPHELGAVNGYNISFSRNCGCGIAGQIDVDGDGVCDCEDPDGDGTCGCGPGWVDDGSGDCQECAAIGPTYIECVDGTCGVDADGDGVCDELPPGCNCEVQVDCTPAQLDAMDCPDCSCDTPGDCSATQLEALDCEPTDCDCDAEAGAYLYTREDGVEVYNACTSVQRSECESGKCESCCRSGEVVYECDCTKPNGVILGENENGDLVRNTCTEYQRSECVGQAPDVMPAAGVFDSSDIRTPLEHYPNAIDYSDFAYVGDGPPSDIRVAFPIIGSVSIPMSTAGHPGAETIRVGGRLICKMWFIFLVIGRVHTVVRQY